MREWLTTADVAAMLRVSPQRVRALVQQRNRQRTREAVQRGEVAVWIGRKHGRDWLFTADEVEQLRPGPCGRPRR